MWPLRSMRKHSVITLPPALCTSPDSRSIDLHARWRLASGDGGASAVFGATLDHTAWMTGSKIGTATWAPVAPPPRVRRLPTALSVAGPNPTGAVVGETTKQASLSPPGGAGLARA